MEQITAWHFASFKDHDFLTPLRRTRRQGCDAIRRRCSQLKIWDSLPTSSARLFRCAASFHPHPFWFILHPWFFILIVDHHFSASDYLRPFQPAIHHTLHTYRYLTENDSHSVLPRLGNFICHQQLFHCFWCIVILQRPVPIIFLIDPRTIGNARFPSLEIRSYAVLGHLSRS